MTKAESIAYLRKLKAQDESVLPEAAGVIPSTKQDKEDELGRMDTFREFSRDQNKHLTSDET